MRTLLYVGAAAVSLMAIPAVSTAQSATTNSIDDKSMAAEAVMEMSAEQQAMYDGWPMDRRTTYDAWPGPIQVYYWDLEPTYQDAWWMLTDDQRVQVYELTPAQRTATWNAIMAQVNGTATPAASNMSNSNASTTGMANSNATTTTRFVSNATVQNVPTNTVTGEYPVCQGDETDSCIQPREAGLNYGNRPLDYWPGEPASLND